MGPYQNQDPITNFFNALGNNGFWYWLLGVAFIVLIFFIIREILCWYWKINERLDVLYKISGHVSNTNALLKTLIKQLQGGGSESQERIATPDLTTQVLPQSGQLSEKLPRPSTEKKHYISKSILLLSSWVKSVSRDLLNILINRKRPIIIIILLLVIGASVAVLAPIAWKLWLVWYKPQ